MAYHCADGLFRPRYLGMEKALKRKLKGGRFNNVPPTRSKTMSAIRGRGNRTTELAFRLAMVRAGISGWKVRPASLPGSPDFYFPTKHLAVFVDGCFWHGCPKCGHIPKTRRAFWKEKLHRNQERDRMRTQQLESKGIRVLRLWEHEINEDRVQCITRLTALLLSSPQQPPRRTSR